MKYIKISNKKLVSLVIIPILLLMTQASIQVARAGTGPFDGLTVLYRVKTQADVDALPLDINALGYDIAILVEGSGLTIEGLSVHDAEMFGIAVDGQIDVTVSGCEVYNIGHHTGSEFDPNGGQYGVAIYYYASSGRIDSNIVWNYQKNGITANLPSSDGESVNIIDNTVTGFGQIDFIAQNGIQLGWDAKGLVKGNTVSGNWYTGGYWVACNILLVYTEGVKVLDNELIGGQVGIYAYGDDNKVNGNDVEGEQYGEYDSYGYGSWGIIVYGDNNKVVRNTIGPYDVGAEIWGNNNKLIRNTFDDCVENVLDFGEGTKIHANVYP